jgi:hypothetical protein
MGPRFRGDDALCVARSHATNCSRFNFQTARDVRKHGFAISRREAPEVCQKFPYPLNQRAQGIPGARCTRGLVRNSAQKKRTRAYRFSGGNPAFPAQWFTAYFVLSPVIGLVCHRRRRKFISANLTPASRRQDHTTSPSARQRSRLQRRLRPPHPAPTFVTMANAPLRDGMART